MLNKSSQFFSWLIWLCLIFVVNACVSAEPVVDSVTTVESLQAQAVSTATPNIADEPVSAPAPSATELPTEIVEPISPISPVPTAEESLSVGLVETMNPMPGSAEPLAAAIDDLAQQSGVSLDQISLVSIEARQWSDAGLGCPQEGFMYAQVITPGYLIILEAAGSQYRYHTDQNTAVILCEE